MYKYIIMDKPCYAVRDYWH